MKYKYDVALPEDFRLDDVKKVMEARGYEWAHRFSAEELQLAEEIWLLPNDRGAVRYVYDHFVEVPSIRAESDIHGEPAKILLDLDSDLPCFEIGELTEQASSSSPERVYALRALASITTVYDGGVVSTFKDALKDPDPGIRRLVMACIARYPYFIFVKDLEQGAETEQDPELKAEALRLAKDLREHGKRGTF